MTAEQTFSMPGKGDQSDHSVHRFDFKRSGDSASLHCGRSPNEKALLATPAHSVRARRKSPGSTWEVEDDSKVAPDQAYRRVLNSINNQEPTHMSAPFLLEIAQMMGNYGDTSTFKVTALERFAEDGRQYVRVRIEDERKPQPSFVRTVTAVLSADDHFAVRSTEYEDREGGKGHGTYVYDRHDGIPVLRSSKIQYPGRDGRSTTSELKVIERKFGPLPESEFTTERFLNGPTVLKSTNPYADDAWQVTLSNWYGAPLAAGMVCLIGGSLAGGWTRFRRKPDPVTSLESRRGDH